MRGTLSSQDEDRFTGVSVEVRLGLTTGQVVAVDTSSDEAEAGGVGSF